MATYIGNDRIVLVNAIDLSDHVRSVEVSQNPEMQDATRMGHTARISIPGLDAWTITVEFLQDHAAGEVDATLNPLVGSGAATFPVVVRPVSGAVSATNPSWSGQCTLESYQPVRGAVGEIATTTVAFRARGNLTRLTA